MKWKIVHALSGTLMEDAAERLKAPETTELFGGVYLTANEVVWSRLLKHYAMPYAEIAWAYKQIEESHVSLGCCGGVLEEFRVVLLDARLRRCVVTFDRERFADALLECIAEKNPRTAIGYTVENRSRFGRVEG